MQSPDPDLDSKYLFFITCLENVSLIMVLDPVSNTIPIWLLKRSKNLLKVFDVIFQLWLTVGLPNGGVSSLKSFLI